MFFFCVLGGCRPKRRSGLASVIGMLAHVHVQLRDGRECTVEPKNLTIIGRIAAREIRDELSWIESNRA